MNKLFDISGKIAIVTGASVGLGRAMAEGLAEAGATVIVANRNVEEGKAAADEMRANGLDAHSHPVDISDKQSIENLFNFV